MQKNTALPARFTLGNTLFTPGANALIQAEKINASLLLQRHQSGDWGDLAAEDARVNERALAHGARILSVYSVDEYTKVWIITEADRSSTTILLPEEY